MITKVTKLFQNESFMRYFRNSSWMMAEYSLRIVSAIFVSIYVARYLGPEQFGVLSYALAIVSIFMAISRLGMESILVRDIAKSPFDIQSYMGTAFGLMVVASIGALCLLSSVVYFYESDPQTKVYIFIIALGLLFQTFLVVDYGFQGQVKAKYSSIAKSLALGTSSAVKVYLVLIEADLIVFAVAFALDHFFIATSLLITHFIQKNPNFIFSFRRRLIKPLLQSAWPMILSALAAILYVRIDQLMIKNMLDAQQLGLYAAAIKIYEGWIIIPFVISISLMPAIVKLREGSPEIYERNMSLLLMIVFWVGVILAIAFMLWGHWIIGITFGNEYSEASLTLGIVMWAAAFTAVGTVSARYMIAEGMEKKIAVRTFFALIINIVLNYYLIPIYGIEGAAFATLITMFMANYLINYIDSDLKQLTRICNNAIFVKAVFFKGR